MGTTENGFAELASPDTKIEKIISESDKIEEARVESPEAFVVAIGIQNNLPSYPSAQLWYTMNSLEKEALKNEVSKTMIWEDYEAQMIRHFPPSVKRKIS